MKEFIQERDKTGQFTGRIIPREKINPRTLQNIDTYERTLNSYQMAHGKLEKAIERVKKTREPRVYIGATIGDVYIGYGNLRQAEYQLDAYKRGIEYYKEELKKMKKNEVV